jgi:hypothetical protein
MESKFHNLLSPEQNVALDEFTEHTGGDIYPSGNDYSSSHQNSE